MVYEDEEPDMRDPNYDESAQVSGYSRHVLFTVCICLWKSQKTCVFGAFF